MAIGYVAVLLLAGALAAGLASAHIRPNNLWTASQAEVIRVVRGTRLYVVKCSGRGSRRSTFRHFACSGQTARDPRSPRTALVTYVLHTLGGYYGRRSGYFATNVRFSAFFVP